MALTRIRLGSGLITALVVCAGFALAMAVPVHAATYPIPCSSLVLSAPLSQVAFTSGGPLVVAPVARTADSGCPSPIPAPAETPPAGNKLSDHASGALAAAGGVAAGGGLAAIIGGVTIIGTVATAPSGFRRH